MNSFLFSAVLMSMKMLLILTVLKRCLCMCLWILKIIWPTLMLTRCWWWPCPVTPRHSSPAHPSCLTPLFIFWLMIKTSVTTTCLIQNKVSCFRNSLINQNAKEQIFRTSKDGKLWNYQILHFGLIWSIYRKEQNCHLVHCLVSFHQNTDKSQSKFK